MILSVSRRTDIPCRYAEWWMNRIRAGSVLVRNPMNAAQVSRVPLSPETVDCIVFWSKDPAPLLPHLPELDARGYSYYFQFTVTPYGRDLEPGLREKYEIEQTFCELAKRIGKQKVVWRYDPILMNREWSVSRHKEEFARLCETFANATDTVTISFVDAYAKRKNPPYWAPNAEEVQEFSQFAVKTAREYRLNLTACCEAGLPSAWGILPARCIDPERIAGILDESLSLREDRNQRSGCGCYESVDVGIYNTCPNGCAYCYANRSESLAQERFCGHDSNGELLFGAVSPDMIREKPVHSNRTGQINF